MKTVYLAIAVAVSVSVSAPAEAQNKSRSGYLFSCLKGGCDFICYSAAGIKGAALFQRRNVKEVEFPENSGTGIATVRVQNERPTVIRLGGTVFCEMADGIVKAGHSFQ